MVEYTTVETALGIVGLARSGAGIVAATLPQDSVGAAIERLEANISPRQGPVTEALPDAFGTLCDQLMRYASGVDVAFDVELDLAGWTGFQVRVWQATRAIPYGETRSYSWVADAAGHPGAQRAAGQALHRNPVPILVPCHRVIGADGTLTGFGGGLQMKRALLELEASGARGQAIL
jgi:methylated-DNA-[protein]-cysteine S-methyltransferase